MIAIAFYGKGGIGKSTIVANIAFLFKKNGYNVLQVGCDPKHDSAMKHILGSEIRTVMGEFERTSQTRHDTDWLKSLVMIGKDGVHCIEAGGPEPGKGCAGRAISLVIQLFKEIPNFYENYDVVIYDVLGDVVCGGFASPLRLGMATGVYIVISGDAMSLYAANNIVKGIINLSGNKIKVRGLIANLRNTPGEKEIIKGFSETLKVEVAGYIPHDEKVSIAELNGMTATEMYPKSTVANAYTQVYKTIISTNSNPQINPSPLSDSALEKLYRQHLELLLSNKKKPQITQRGKASTKIWN